ncbi:sensor histidine kinase [Croceicoccus bisphenolivorans]|uniref:sensor histidine kinase n=1 Tax=Croceicoccus bisphenolivorans TaxID=1783232 RepID=UPI000832CF41|nr:HWE histidine kinase domain-containing protein [Croceicoccus bisphenolivorans]
MAYGNRDNRGGVGDPVLLHDKRLEALAEYEVLDSEAERSFDDIAFIAKSVCQTPVALVSLVEEDRQWFKARIGFEACETPIEQSVCRHGLVSRDLLVIPDLTADPRTRDNPLVLTDPNIRFYAGAPLVTPIGTAIGMLCVIDVAPRPEGLTPEQQRALSGLANQVITQLELRKALREKEARLREEQEEATILRRAMDRLQMAEEAGEIGAYEADFASRTITVSREFCRIYGIEPRQAIAIEELNSRVPGTAEIDAVITGATDFGRGEFKIERANDGCERWIDIRARYLRDDAGNRTGVTGVVSDVTDQRAINEEISHRLKNTMALVQAIAGHTLRHIADPEPVQEFNRRVSALATAHDILLSRTSAVAFFHEVADGVLARLSVDDRVEIAGRNVELSSRAVLVLSMLLHELGTNAMKYGSLSADGGKVTLDTTIETREDGEWLMIEWRETGGPAAQPPEKLGLGTRLIQRGLAPDGQTDLSYDAAGFCAVIASPVSQIRA